MTTLLSTNQTPWLGFGWMVLGALALLPSIAEAKRVTKPLPYATCFASSAAAHNLTVTLLQAVVATESDWNPRARSHANAHGLMQIQWPGTAKHLGVRRVSQLYRPCTNIELGARYLRELLDRYNNDERRALAAYNYGPGRIGASGPIPKGADKYVATVRKHKKRLGGSGVLLGDPTPDKSLKKARTKAPAEVAVADRQHVVTFTSRARAARYARLLRKRVPRTTFTVQRRAGDFQVWLTGGVSKLTADDRTLLTSLGWGA